MVISVQMNRFGYNYWTKSIEIFFIESENVQKFNGKVGQVLFDEGIVGFPGLFWQPLQSVKFRNT